MSLTAPVAQVPPAAMPVESAAKFDKSDQVLFKAQDEFLRRLKEKSAKATKPAATMRLNAATTGMTMTLPPKPTKSPPPSLAADDQKEEKQHSTDVDMRKGNVDLRKISKDLDARMKETEEDSSKKDIKYGFRYCFTYL
jgi:hypothetical protein